jgi:hypothetical protein
MVDVAPAAAAEAIDHPASDPAAPSKSATDPGPSAQLSAMTSSAPAPFLTAGSATTPRKPNPLEKSSKEPHQTARKSGKNALFCYQGLKITQI